MMYHIIIPSQSKLIIPRYYEKTCQHIEKIILTERKTKEFRILGMEFSRKGEGWQIYFDPDKCGLFLLNEMSFNVTPKLFLEESETHFGMQIGHQEILYKTIIKDPDSVKKQNEDGTNDKQKNQFTLPDSIEDTDFFKTRSNLGITNQNQWLNLFHLYHLYQPPHEDRDGLFDGNDEQLEDPYVWLLDRIMRSHQDSLQKSIVGFYEIIEENSPALKGQINFYKSVRTNLGLQHKHVFTHMEFNQDHIIYEFIKSAIMKLSNMLTEHYNHNPLESIFAKYNRILSNFTILPMTPHLLKSAKEFFNRVPRRMKLIKPLLSNLINIIEKTYNIDSNDPYILNAMTITMSKAFEALCDSLIRQYAPETGASNEFRNNFKSDKQKNKEDGNRNLSYKSDNNKNLKVDMEPDQLIVCRKPGYKKNEFEIKYIFDAKYKKYSLGANFYQLMIYQDYAKKHNANHYAHRVITEAKAISVVILFPITASSEKNKYFDIKKIEGQDAIELFIDKSYNRALGGILINVGELLANGVEQYYSEGDFHNKVDTCGRKYSLEFKKEVIDQFKEVHENVEKRILEELK